MLHLGYNYSNIPKNTVSCVLGSDWALGCCCVLYQSKWEENMMSARSLLELLLSFPKTVYFNLKVFRFKTAIKLPVVISWKVKIRALAKGSVIVPQNCKTGSITIGFGGTSSMNVGTAEIDLSKGTVEFLGRAHFSRGVCLKNTGKLVIGDHFSANTNLRLTCAHEITIEDHAMLGWNVVIRDADGHYIIENGAPKANVGKIHIGKHVWLCSESHILKGVEIGNDCVVAYRSLVTSKFAGNNLMIAGMPAKVIKENINWQV